MKICNKKMFELELKLFLKCFRGKTRIKSEILIDLKFKLIQTNGL